MRVSASAASDVYKKQYIHTHRSLFRLKLARQSGPPKASGAARSQTSGAARNKALKRCCIHSHGVGSSAADTMAVDAGLLQAVPPESELPGEMEDREPDDVFGDLDDKALKRFCIPSHGVDSCSCRHHGCECRIASGSYNGERAARGERGESGGEQGIEAILHSQPWCRQLQLPTPWL